MKLGHILFAAALACWGAAPARAVDTPAPVTERVTTPLAIRTFGGAGVPRLTLTTTAWRDGELIPFDNTTNIGFPGLVWSAGPAATRAYVIITQHEHIEGLIGDDTRPLWSMYNISERATSIAAGMTTPPDPAHYGPSMNGAGEPYHLAFWPKGPLRFHIQIFALDTTVTLPPNSAYPDLARAMQGHVLAAGELTGVSVWPAGMAVPVSPPPPAPPPPRQGAEPF